MKKYIALVLALLLLLSLTACTQEKTGEDDPQKDSGENGSQMGQTTASTEPTPPPITWMTFPADRVLTAKQYFVFDCETGEFLTIS